MCDSQNKMILCTYVLNSPTVKNKMIFLKKCQKLKKGYRLEFLELETKMCDKNLKKTSKYVRINHQRRDRLV